MHTRRWVHNPSYGRVILIWKYLNSLLWPQNIKMDQYAMCLLWLIRLYDCVNTDHQTHLIWALPENLHLQSRNSYIPVTRTSFTGCVLCCHRWFNADQLSLDAISLSICKVKWLLDQTVSLVCVFNEWMDLDVCVFERIQGIVQVLGET